MLKYLSTVKILRSVNPNNAVQLQIQITFNDIIMTMFWVSETLWKGHDGPFLNVYVEDDGVRTSDTAQVLCDGSVEDECV